MRRSCRRQDTSEAGQLIENTLMISSRCNACLPRINRRETGASVSSPTACPARMTEFFSLFNPSGYAVASIKPSSMSRTGRSALQVLSASVKPASLPSASPRATMAVALRSPL